VLAHNLNSQLPDYYRLMLALAAQNGKQTAIGTGFRQVAH
jgi:hypothetical protein